MIGLALHLQNFVKTLSLSKLWCMDPNSVWVSLIGVLSSSEGSRYGIVKDFELLYSIGMSFDF